ncbi:MAG: hypothetical protein HYV63_01495, partial [Candidatus Schekmanbacteria bacterium]|nr:hypothetical protein [Candidatus Schekmanbacteria bacterium]
MNRSPEDIAADLSGIELELKNLLNRLGTEMTAALLARLDLRANGVIVGEKAYRRRREDGATEIMSTFGPTAITYALYEERGGHGGKTIAPLLMRLGLVDDFWTPRAAEVGALFVQATTPAESHRLLAAASGMTASPSSLDRLPKSIGEVVEKDHEDLEGSIRAAETLPTPSCVAIIAVSLDGVMVPLKDAKPQSVSGGGSEHAQGYREAGCGTISLYDKKGDRLHTIRLARMPEARKVTLHAQLQAELAAIRQRYPQALVVALADGAEENWRILREMSAKLGIELVEEIIDFFHAMEHVSEALRAYAPSERIAKANIDWWHDALLEDPEGVNKVIRALRYRLEHSHGETRRIIKEHLTYVENHRHQMRYATYRARHLPIGSGVQE